ncbi:hypothetical protein BDQ17DRAFT_1428094 [Cyathus striatus]|nr:hypothetical protein BDQ17DRAFT_1428094 [Cyathus striatus]
MDSKETKLQDAESSLNSLLSLSCGCSGCASLNCLLRSQDISSSLNHDGMDGPLLGSESSLNDLLRLWGIIASSLDHVGVGDTGLSNGGKKESSLDRLLSSEDSASTLNHVGVGDTGLNGGKNGTNVSGESSLDHFGIKGNGLGS